MLELREKFEKDMQSVAGRVIETLENIDLSKELETINQKKNTRTTQVETDTHNEKDVQQVIPVDENSNKNETLISP